MAKFYSFKLFLTFLFSPLLIFSQTGNVGIGNTNPLEKLDVSGAIRIGYTSSDNIGTIRYDTLGTGFFEGRVDTGWVKLMGGGGGADDDWRKVNGGTPTVTDDIYHTGNVGIGTSVPLTKLHIKGLGGIAIQAETSNSTDTMPAINAINTIGIAVRAISYAYSDTLPAIWAVSDSGVAILAETSSDTFPALKVVNKDSTGFALVAVSWAALDTINGEVVVTQGGNAIESLGDFDIRGAVRNSDSTLYGGSVAVNDGMTVGDIAGASCTPATAALDSFVKNFGASFVLIKQGRSNNPIYSNIKTFSTTKDCRAVTNFYFEPYVGDEQVWPLDFEIFVRDEFIGSVYEPSANLNQNPPLPDYHPNGPLVLFENNPSLCGCWTSKWGIDNSVFNGEDPNDVANNNWYVQFNSNTSDGEYLFAYKGRVDYKWADSILAPQYAAYGDIRASGSIYANSDDLLGDVAEYFKVNTTSARQPEVGDIVSISRKDPQSFELTTTENDPLIAGVVSENPSVHLNDPSSGHPIGLTGRVKVKVNLKGGKINIGDPITSSSVEGVGMKANGSGTIVGYALEAFDGSRTDEGKIIILLAQGHVERVPSGVKIEQVDAPSYGGTLVKGAYSVSNDEKVVFIAWDDKLAGRIPADVEFDDLFVELTPFGGNAKMIVKDVDAAGITVEIIERSAGFQGFYYQTDIVTYNIESLNPVSVNTSVSDADLGSYEERVTTAIQLKKEWDAAFAELQKKGGMSLEPLQKMTNGKQASLYKKEVAASWKRNAPELLEHWLSLGMELSRVVNRDQSIIRKIKGQ